MAKELTDIKIGADNDLDIEGGDFAFAIDNAALGDFACTEQHQKAIIIDANGDYKQNPTITVAAITYKDDTNPDRLLQAIAQKFGADGMDVDSVEMGADKKIRTNANY